MGFTDQKRAGTPSASFNANKGYGIGTTWSGVITEVGEDRQATKYGTDGELEFWEKSGQKRMTRPIVIQAKLNGQSPPPVSDEDDGQRALWFKDGTGMFDALSAAILAHPQAREPEPGDWISIKWVSTDEATNAKKYEAEWRPAPKSNFVAGQQPPAQPRQRETVPPTLADDLPPF